MDDENGVEKQKETGLDLEKATEFPNDTVHKILDGEVRAENAWNRIAGGINEINITMG